MRKSTAPFLEERLSGRFVERVIAAAEEEPEEDRLQAGLEAAVAFAEADPGEARAALCELRGDPEALARLERCLGAGGEGATLALGAAIQLAVSELASPAPDLRSHIPELMRWLESDW
jgi:hypothetical protein